MWDWLKKVGKIALVAAPYIAAPFTGGASLLATGLANSAENAWAKHDAEAAIAKGEAPSKFDSILGKVAGTAGLATSVLGGFGGLPGGMTGGTGSIPGTGLGPSGSTLSKVLNATNAGLGAAQLLAPSGGGSQSVPSGNTSAPTTPGIGGPTMGQSGGLAAIMASGRKDALRSQPFRAGYNVTTPNADPTLPPTVVATMPRIYSKGIDRQGYFAGQNPNPIPTRKKKQPIGPSEGQDQAIVSE